MPVVKSHEFFDYISRGPLAPAYLVAGEESYFVGRALAKLTEKALEGCAARDFNYDLFYGKDTSADAVAARADSLPMMAERRLVVLKEADRLRDIEPLKGYLASPSETTVLLLVAEGADRGKEAELTKAMPARGVSVHFYHPFERDLARHVKMLAREQDIDMDDDAVEYLKDALEGNLALIESELKKAQNYLGERKRMTVDDVKESVGCFGLPLVFDLLDAAAGGKPGKALSILSRLLSEGEAPLMLLGLMAGHWRKLLQAKEMVMDGEPEDKIVKTFRLTFLNRKQFLGQVARLSLEELERAFTSFHRADRALKGSAVPNDILMARLVMDLCGGKR